MNDESEGENFQSPESFIYWSRYLHGYNYTKIQIIWIYFYHVKPSNTKKFKNEFSNDLGVIYYPSNNKFCSK